MSRVRGNLGSRIWRRGSLRNSALTKKKVVRRRGSGLTTAPGMDAVLSAECCCRTMVSFVFVRSTQSADFRRSPRRLLSWWLVGRRIVCGRAPRRFGCSSRVWARQSWSGTNHAFRTSVNTTNPTTSTATMGAFFGGLLNRVCFFA